MTARTLICDRCDAREPIGVRFLSEVNPNPPAGWDVTMERALCPSCAAYAKANPGRQWRA
jgi:hypothetical protein